GGGSGGGGGGGGAAGAPPAVPRSPYPGRGTRRSAGRRQAAVPGRWWFRWVSRARSAAPGQPRPVRGARSGAPGQAGMTSSVRPPEWISNWAIWSASNPAWPRVSKGADAPAPYPPAGTLQVIAVCLSPALLMTTSSQLFGPTGSDSRRPMSTPPRDGTTATWAVTWVAGSSARYTGPVSNSTWVASCRAVTVRAVECPSRNAPPPSANNPATAAESRPIHRRDRRRAAARSIGAGGSSSAGRVPAAVPVSECPAPREPISVTSGPALVS